MAVLIEKSGTFDARHIQARSLRWTLFKKLKYVAINSAVAYIPLYLVSSFAALKNIAIDPRLFVFTALLVVFLLFAGALINLVEYLILRFMLSHFWREAARGVVCFGRMVNSANLSSEREIVSSGRTKLASSRSGRENSNVSAKLPMRSASMTAWVSIRPLCCER